MISIVILKVSVNISDFRLSTPLGLISQVLKSAGAKFWGDVFADKSSSLNSTRGWSKTAPKRRPLMKSAWRKALGPPSIRTRFSATGMIPLIAEAKIRPLLCNSIRRKLAKMEWRSQEPQNQPQMMSKWSVMTIGWFCWCQKTYFYLLNGFDQPPLKLREVNVAFFFPIFQVAVCQSESLLVSVTEQKQLCNKATSILWWLPLIYVIMSINPHLTKNLRFREGSLYFCFWSSEVKALQI